MALRIPGYAEPQHPQQCMTVTYILCNKYKRDILCIKITKEADMITWLMTIGSGGISRGPSRVGISENFIREHSRIYQQKHLNNDCNDQTRCPEKTFYCTQKQDTKELMNVVRVMAPHNY